MGPEDELAPAARLARIERLLEEGNGLRREALALQREALELQRGVVEQTRANLEQARRINDGAAFLQLRARRMQVALGAVVLLLVGYMSWLLFFRLTY